MFKKAPVRLAVKFLVAVKSEESGMIPLLHWKENTQPMSVNERNVQANKYWVCH